MDMVWEVNKNVEFGFMEPSSCPAGCADKELLNFVLKGVLTHDYVGQIMRHENNFI
jgi:hypothetical protein